MEISTTQYKHTDVVTISGRIDSATAPKLEEVLKKITEDGRYKVVLDMHGVEYLSSSGLRVIIDTQKTCRHLSRGELVLASVPERIKSTLDLAGFLPFFKLFDETTAAVGSF